MNVSHEQISSSLYLNDKLAAISQLIAIKGFIENHLSIPLVIFALTNNLLTINTIVLLLKKKQNSSKCAYTFYLFIAISDILALFPFIYIALGMNMYRLYPLFIIMITCFSMNLFQYVSHYRINTFSFKPLS